MRRWLLRRAIMAFGRTYGYDTSYVMAMLRADLGTAWRFARLPGIGRRRCGMPAAPWFAAKLRAMLAEDCGPCTQLLATMAERAGVAAPVLRAAIVGDYASLPAEVALACRFADAVAARDPEADALRQHVVELWGEPAMVALSVSMAVGRVYPAVKYAMGYGRACTRVSVAGGVVPVLRHAA
jgi:hypothetical protein